MGYNTTSSYQSSGGGDFTATWMYSLNIVATIFIPANVVLGLIACAAVIIFMPCAQIARKVRIFYIASAALEVISLLFTSLFDTMLSDVLPFLTNGGLGFNLENLSPLACRFTRYLMFFSENAGGYLVLVFALERLIVVVYPFKAKMLTVRRSVSCVLLTLLFAASLNLFTFFSYGPKEGDAVNSACSPKGAPSLFLSMFTFNYTVPNCLLLAVAVMIMYAMRSHLKKNENLTNKTNAHEKGETKSRKTTRILVILAAIRCCIYVPFALLYMTWQFVPNPLASFVIRVFANYFQVVSGLVAICDFVVYVECIPSFRKLVFPCC